MTKRSLWFTAWLVACVGVEPVALPTVQADCDPLMPGMCGMPYPSSFHLREDAATATGLRMHLRQGSLPVRRDGTPLDPTDWNRKDGFSISSPILLDLPGATLQGLPRLDDIGASLEPGSPSILWDVTTGERVAHWVELDDTAPDAGQRLVIVRPAQPLRFDHQYVYGLTEVVGESGPLSSSPAFEALRDGTASELPTVELRRDWFEREVFGPLAQAGAAREDLLVAFDFHTASREGTLGEMISLRDDALGTLDGAGPAYRLDEVIDHDCEADGQRIGREITGHVTVPYYTEVDAPGRTWVRDADDLPVRQGLTEAPFLVLVPCSVLQAEEPRPVVQYGHGLLGGMDEARSGWLRELAEERSFTVLASNWTGFATDDALAIYLMVGGDLSGMAMIPERASQGMIEKMFLVRALQGDLGADAALQGEGGPLIDASRIHYYGNSQGGIMGAAYLAMSPDIQRGVLGVPGGPYSLLLPRSKDFDPFFDAIKESYADHRDIMWLVAGLMQQQWDPVEPGGWMWDLTAGEQPKEVLLQVAIGDVQVSSLGAHVMARAYGAVSVGPAPRELWGIEEIEGGVQGAAIAEYDYSDVPAEPLEAIPPEGPDPHECPRRNPAAQQQLWTFLDNGFIQNFCDGPCRAVQAECR